MWDRKKQKTKHHNIWTGQKLDLVWNKTLKKFRFIHKFRLKDLQNPRIQKIFFSSYFISICIYINISGVVVLVTNRHEHGNDITFFRGSRRPPVWEQPLWPRDVLEKLPRVCSDQTSWTPATAQGAQPPHASPRHHNAPVKQDQHSLKSKTTEGNRDETLVNREKV